MAVNRKRVGIVAAIVVVALVAGVGFMACVFTRRGLRFPSIAVATIGGQDVLVIDHMDYSPLAKTELLDARIDSGRILITSYAAFWNPLAPEIHDRWPLVIRDPLDSLSEGAYEVACWNRQYSVLGTLIIDKERNLSLRDVRPAPVSPWDRRRRAAPHD